PSGVQEHMLIAPPSLRHEASKSTTKSKMKIFLLFGSHNGSSNEADIHHKAMQRHRLLTFVYHKGFQVILHEVFTAARCALTQMAAEICGHALTFKCSDISLRRVFSAAAHTAERPPERQSSDDCLGQNVRVRRHRNISPCADPAIR
ncbi:hypothetical protein KUCAC02_035023, partial [Chaenocephalus aceratus]